MPSDSLQAPEPWKIKIDPHMNWTGFTGRLARTALDIIGCGPSRIQPRLSADAHLINIASLVESIAQALNVRLPEFQLGAVPMAARTLGSLQHAMRAAVKLAAAAPEAPSAGQIDVLTRLRDIALAMRADFRPDPELLAWLDQYERSHG